MRSAVTIASSTRWLSFDGASAHLYLDGREVATRESSVVADRISPRNYRVGYTQMREDKATRTCFAGKLRDVRVYGRALVVREIAALGRPTSLR